MVDSILLESIEKELNDKAYKSLVAYAQYIMNNFYMCRRIDKVVPEGYTAEDFVQEAITKIFCGERKWNQENNPDLISSLRGHIKSIISNVFSKKEHHDFTKISTNLYDDDNFDSDIKDESLSNETLHILKELVLDIRKVVSDDEDLKNILFCYEGGIYTRREIAEYLEITPDEVTNRLKRLHRKLKEIKKEYDE